MPDHFVDTELAPMVAISFAAAVTDQLRVGMLVLGNDYKHPAVTAKEAATVDLLSDGRLEFGLGAGWMQTDYEALGLAYDSPGVRIDRLEEALAIVKGAWGDEPFNYTGPSYTIRSYNGIPKPVQQPRPPIADRRRRPAAPAPGRARSRHRRHQPQPPSRRYHHRRDPVRSRRPDPTEDRLGPRRAPATASTTSSSRFATSCPPSPTTPEGSPKASPPASALTADEALASGTVLAGTVDEVCDTLQQRREEWGVSYIILGDNNFPAFGPVVARLAGT